MSKVIQKKEAKADPKPAVTARQSAAYSIKRFSMHCYQLVQQLPDGTEKLIGPENIFEIVSTQLNDQILRDLKVGQ